MEVATNKQGFVIGIRQYTKPNKKNRYGKTNKYYENLEKVKAGEHKKSK